MGESQMWPGSERARIKGPVSAVGSKERKSREVGDSIALLARCQDRNKSTHDSSYS